MLFPSPLAVHKKKKKKKTDCEHKNPARDEESDTELGMVAPFIGGQKPMEKVVWSPHEGKLQQSIVIASQKKKKKKRAFFPDLNTSAKECVPVRWYSRPQRPNCFDSEQYASRT